MGKQVLGVGLVFLLLVINGLAGWAQPNSSPADSLGRKAKVSYAPKTWHQVQPGDTYYGLAKTYRVPIDSLFKWNGESLPVGKRIRVTAPGFTVKAPAATTRSAASAGTDFPIAASNETKISSSVSSHQEPENSLHNTTATRYEKAGEAAVVNKTTQRVLVIPFDPYLYFSDADEDIARQSRLARPNVRYIFRSRLSAFLEPNGYETINLLSGKHHTEANELSKIYKSLQYSYQNVTASRFNPLPAKQKTLATGPKAWFQKQKEKAGFAIPEEASIAAEGEKYYGVKVKSTDFYSFFNRQYNPDYYLFINQFEIRTDYTNCIDRTTQNFTREFLVHYSIFDGQGELIAGNKVKIPYVSNINDIEKIGRDNLGKIAQRILADLPPPQLPDDQAAQN